MSARAFSEKSNPAKDDYVDIRRGIAAAFELGETDYRDESVGGAAGGLVLGVEAIEGTDELIKRCSAYKRKDRRCSGKLRKPQQDMRIDLPTMALGTVENAKASGLNGLAVHAGNSR